MFFCFRLLYLLADVIPPRTSYAMLVIMPLFGNGMTPIHNVRRGTWRPYILRIPTRAICNSIVKLIWVDCRICGNTRHETSLLPRFSIYFQFYVDIGKIIHRRKLRIIFGVPGPLE